jgi:RHS repeat-associated protein
MTASVVAGTARGYRYDGDGLLNSRTQASTTTSFVYDPSVAPAPVLVAGTERVVHGLGPLYRVHANGTYDTFVRDGLGSVRLELSGTGAITNAFDYAAYGNLNTSTQPLLGFAGELTDPSGLIYLRARWYDPAAGRFVSRDPLWGELTRPVTLNVFGYARGNPVTWIDPSGLDPSIGDPDAFDYYRLTLGFSVFDVWGLNAEYVRSRYGTLYSGFSTGPGLSATPVSASFVGGKLEPHKVALREDIGSLIEGFSTVASISPGGIGNSLAWSPSGLTAREEGIYTPQLGVSGGVARQTSVPELIGQVPMIARLQVLCMSSLGGNSGLG